MRTRRVPGSTRLRLSDLLASGGMLMPFRARSIIGKDQQQFDPVDRAVNSARQTHPPLFIAAPPGAGKSTLAYTVWNQLAEPLIVNGADGAADIGLVPILIDLRDYREEVMSPDFGSREWLIRRLDDSVGSSNAFNWVSISTSGLGVPTRAFIILDSLDELLAALPSNAIAEIVNRFTFRVAQVICCRLQFYERYLNTIPFAYGDVAQLELPRRDEQWSFVHDYYKACFPQVAEGLEKQFRRRLESSPRLADVCRNPLRLTMALDLLSPLSDELPRSTDLSTLYSAYIDNLLKVEAARRDSILEPEAKFELLKNLAWKFYDEGTIGASDAPPFTNARV